MDWKRRWWERAGITQAQRLGLVNFRFARLFEQFSRGDNPTDMKDAAKFWTMIVGEHADFIAFAYHHGAFFDNEGHATQRHVSEARQFCRRQRVRLKKDE